MRLWAFEALRKIKMGVNEQKLASVPGEPAGPKLGRPVLSTTDAIAQSLAIGPVFSAVFVSALITTSAGSAATLATLISALGAICLGWVVVLYARRFIGAGAVYDYIRLSTNPKLGLFTAVIYFIGVLMLGVAGPIVALGVFTSGFLADFGWPVPWWVCALLAAFLVFLVNHYGVQTTTRTQLALTIIGVTPLIILAGIICWHGGVAGHSLRVLNPRDPAAGSLTRGVLFAITLFFGFEASASLGEETANPRRAIPIAVMITLLVSSVFYVLIVYSATIAVGVNSIQGWAKDSAPFTSLAQAYMGKWLAVWVDIALLVDTWAIASAFTVTSARGCFALSRNKCLPEWFSKVSKHSTPLAGNLVALSSSLLWIAAAVILPSIGPLVVFGISLVWGSILIGLIYFVLPLIAIRFLPRGRHIWQWPILAGATVAPVLGIVGAIVPFPPYPSSLGIYAALLSIALALFWTLSRKPVLNATRNPGSPLVSYQSPVDDHV